MDDLVEGIETFTVELSSSSGDITLGAPLTATIIILDDSSKRYFAFCTNSVLL